MIVRYRHSETTLGIEIGPLYDQKVLSGRNCLGLHQCTDIRVVGCTHAIKGGSDTFEGLEEKENRKNNERMGAVKR
jgi:hypothetical protein